MIEHDDMNDGLPSLPTEHVEHSILGAILTDPHAFDKISDKIAANNFMQGQHRKIYMAMRSLSERNEGIDITTVDAELKSLKLWEDPSCFIYLCELAKNSTGSANILHYANYLLKHGTIKNLREACQKIYQLTDENIEPSEMIDKADGMILEIQTSSVRGGGPQKMSNVIRELLNSLDEDPHPPLSTGFIDLDHLMDGGMRPGELIVIAGRPGQGKTTLGINIATNVATSSPDNGVLVFSMEMTAMSLAERIFMALAQVNFRKIRGKPMGDQDAVRITSAISRLKGDTIRVDETGRLSPSEIRARARRDVREYKNLKLIVVDYVQMMRSDTKYDVRANEIGECSGGLKALAKELNIPIIALAQLNRNSVTKGADVREPNMADLKDSGSIEQDADMVALIHREDTYKEDTEYRGLAKIIVDKQRNGSVGYFMLSFDGANSRFLNYRKF